MKIDSLTALCISSIIGITFFASCMIVLVISDNLILQLLGIPLAGGISVGFIIPFFWDLIDGDEK